MCISGTLELYVENTYELEEALSSEVETLVVDFDPELEFEDDIRNIAGAYGYIIDDIREDRVIFMQV